jgi:hypothetical protein
MTHDELLAKLELKRWSFVEYEDYLNYRRALRAVVELHKELKLITGRSTDPTFELSQQVCHACSQFAGIPVSYPCVTVMAIEKELK